MSALEDVTRGFDDHGAVCDVGGPMHVSPSQQSTVRGPSYWMMHPAKMLVLIFWGRRHFSHLKSDKPFCTEVQVVNEPPRLRCGGQ